MGGSASSTTAEICMQVHERTTISMVLNPPKVWERLAVNVHLILKRTHLGNFLSYQQSPSKY